MQLILKLVFFTTFTYNCNAKPVMPIISNHKKKACECVPFVLCQNGTEVVDGAGIIDVRVNFDSNPKLQPMRKDDMCDNIMEVCCESPQLKIALQRSQIVKRGCGIRNFKGVGKKIMSGENGTANETKFGEFPWMVAVLQSTLDEFDVYRCGGALIHRKVVLTAAHCVYGKRSSEVKIRAGEWDTQSTDESLPHQNRAVETILIHERYHKKSLQNDFALLILTDPVNIVENVNIICLPETMRDFDATNCVATGWGKNKLGKEGKYQEILKIIQLSIVNPFTCQRSLRHTMLGKKFELHRSFVCAGGVAGEDMCKGDGGSPLVCPLKKDPKRYIQVGITSWGIGCGTDVPGVYANVLLARPWIDEQLLFHNLDNHVYQHE